jgi:hypothetical protein
MCKLDDRIDAAFADMDVPQHPGAALLVIEHDKIVYRKCYGLADLETQRPITADTSFYLASIAKQFTAMAIMLLAEQRKLNYRIFLHGVRRLTCTICCTTPRVCQATSISLHLAAPVIRS